MRSPLLFLVAALALSACAPAVQGAQGVQSSATSTSPAGPSASPSSVAEPSLSPTPNPSASASASPSTLLSPSPTPPANAAVLGGPAPVGSFVLGDSVILSPRVAPVLSAYGYPVVGLVGQSASETYLRTHLSSPEAQAAPAWVIELGTNNSGDATTVAKVAEWVDLIDSLRTPGAKQKVFWVTPHRAAAYRGGSSEYTLEAVNLELARVATEHRWLRLIDFDAIAAANPTWFDEDNAMHLHPDEQGQAALVALIVGDDPVAASEPAPIITAMPTAQPEVVEPSELPVFDNSVQ